jgi:peptidoglycan/LPS O-acetylase OafA/YrhL
VIHRLVPEAVAHAEQAFHVWLRLPGPGPGRCLYVLVVSVAAAEISWICLERPLNALKRHFPYTPTPRLARFAPEPDGRAGTMVNG